MLVTFTEPIQEQEVCMCVGLPAEDKTYKGCKRELQSRTKKSAVGCTAAYHTLLLHFVITMS